MRKKMFQKMMASGIAMVMGAALLAGCAGGETVNNSEDGAATSTETAADTQENASAQTQENEKAASESVTGAPYFTKGVYINYATEAENPPMTYFYVFYDEKTGCTDDATTGMGLPFACEQSDGKVEFSFGGADGINDVFTVEKVEYGVITGHFDDGLSLSFIPEPGADPDNFDAQNYVSAATGGALIYNDANGWSVKYDPSVISVNGGGHVTTFVYTGESAGTNMITVTYDVGKDAKTAIADIAKGYGENATTSEGPFPGAEDVTGYWATLPPAEDGSGLYETAIARDYMDGYLVFELTGHNSGDDEMDMAVSDALAAVIDSLEFTNN